MKVITPSGKLLRVNSWKALAPGGGRKGPKPWGANGFPSGIMIAEFSGSSIDQFWPPIQPGWYVTATWVNQQGALLRYVWGDGTALTAQLLLSAYENDALDPLLPAARDWSGGNVGPMAMVVLAHGKGSGR